MSRIDAPEDIDVAAMIAALETRRADLQDLAASSADGRATVELDQTRVGRLSRMDALQGQQMALETERRRKAELQRIAAAFARIKDGEYGWCLKCGDSVGKQRLDVDPSTATCVTCAAGG